MQTGGMDLFFRRKEKVEKKEYDRENKIPVLRCSICNGEQVAGFKDKRTGKFEEVCFIRSEQELAAFMNTYGITDIHKEY